MALHNPKSFAVARAGLPHGQWNRLLGKAGLAGLIAIGFLWLLADRLSDMPLIETRSHFFAVAPGQWLTALLATIASFWAVGRYDGVIHRYLATGAHPSDACRAGATAIAVSQTLGLGVITGAILRWRMLPYQTLWQATKITTLVAVFFLSGWAVVTAIVLAALPLAPFKPVAFCVLGLSIILTLISATAPRFHRVRWPNLFIISRLLALAALDTGAAALSLWVLCPPDLALPFAALLPAFLLAYGAGMMSGAPGGVGAFEITLLALLPTVSEIPLLASILAWRAIYFAAPAIIGAGFAIRGPTQKRKVAPTSLRPGLIDHAARAEAGLLKQHHLRLIPAGYDQAWLAGRTAHCLIGVLDPVSGDPETEPGSCDHKRAVTALIDAAKGENRLPVLYKCTARTAVAARQLGLKLRPIAREAWLDPGAFALTTPSRAGLRRKLRRAASAGITITTAPPDWTVLALINAEWAAAHGGERGFSMGRFDRSYLQNQRVFVASASGRPVAFVSFHTGKYEWTLDLMRHTASTPDGTMQALIVAAIADCAAQNIPRLSLAAAPLAALMPAPTARFANLIHRLLGGTRAGLAQFKSSFVPHWQTLYLAAPHKPALALAGAEIAREVRFPPPIPPSFHHYHAEYEIASAV
jgi:phosphatidylglycerol lysyltransferase